jgi:hypothetical protein
VVRFHACEIHFLLSFVAIVRPVITIYIQMWWNSECISLCQVNRFWSFDNVGFCNLIRNVTENSECLARDMITYHWMLMWVLLFVAVDYSF